MHFYLLKCHLFQQLRGAWKLIQSCPLLCSVHVGRGEETHTAHDANTWVLRGSRAAFCWALRASRDPKGISAIQQELSTPRGLLSVFWSALTQLVSSEKICKRLVRALRSSDQMAILPISSRTQPVQNSNTEISKLKPQSCTQTGRSVRSLCPGLYNKCYYRYKKAFFKKQVLSLLKDPLLCTATTGELFSFCAYLISDNTETPMWNCKQNRCTFSLAGFELSSKTLLGLSYA